MATLITFFNTDWRADIKNIQEALEKSCKTMSNMMDDFSENEYEILKLNKLYFTIQIII